MLPIYGMGVNKKKRQCFNDNYNEDTCVVDAARYLMELIKDFTVSHFLYYEVKYIYIETHNTSL